MIQTLKLWKIQVTNLVALHPWKCITAAVALVVVALLMAAGVDVTSIVE